MRVNAVTMVILCVSTWCEPASTWAILAASRTSSDAVGRLFEKPTHMVAVSNGATLAMYCAGQGGPTIVLESGAGENAYMAWHNLQPILAARTRVCSYDRAGFGFSQLGTDLPRDLNHDVADLHDVLHRADEPGPYILVGHSMGGTLVGAFADKYTSEVVGMVLLEPAVVLSSEDMRTQDSAEDREQHRVLDQELEKYRRCEARMRSHEPPTDECADDGYFASLPPRLARLERKRESKAQYWRALRSELENNWSGTDAREAATLLPHRWRSISTRVVTAEVSQVSDQELARATGVSVTDHKALEAIRQNHAVWEKRQARVCEFATDCQVTVIRTADHSVQNVEPARVAQVITSIVDSTRSGNVAK